MGAFGNLLGIRCSVQLGRGPVVMPAPPLLMESVLEIEVRQATERDSGFKIVLSAGREGPLGMFGPPFAGDERFQRGARVVITVWTGVKPTPIFDGIVTKSQYIPGTGAHQGRYVMLGRDLTHVMNQEQKREAHPAQDEATVARKIAATYASYGMVPDVKQPKVIDPPIPLDRTPTQTCTDLSYLRMLARRHGFKVFVDPGPLPGASKLYFGPVPLPGMPQKAMSVNLGPMSDAYDVKVEHDGESFAAARGRVQDRATGQTTELEIPTAAKVPQSLMPDHVTQIGQGKTTETTTSGFSLARMMAELMARVEDSASKVLKVTGTVDNARYNDVLKPYRSVQMRGLGTPYNGTYQVAEVRHRLKPGSYSQTFELHRDGLFPLVPVITPEEAQP